MTNERVMEWLERQPGFWRGRAQMSKLFAEQADGEAETMFLRRAAEYERKAKEL